MHFEKPVPDALRGQFVLYVRVSSWGQASGSRLEQKVDAAQRAARAVSGSGKLRRIFRAVELGQVSAKRPVLLEAIADARDNGRWLLAPDKSRLIRSELYNRRTNCSVEPTLEEMDELMTLCDGVVLATLEDPMLTESERHSLATKRTGRAGRPPEIDHKLASRILEVLGMPIEGPDGRVEWEVPLAVVAKRFGITKSKVQRLVNSPVPKSMCDGTPGLRWKDTRIPAVAYRTARRLAQLEESA